MTGIAFEGNYHTVSDVDELQTYSQLAFDAGKPLLLEVELWARANTRDTRAPLQPQGHAFFKVDPVPSTAPAELPSYAEVLMVGLFAPAYAE